MQIPRNSDVFLQALATYVQQAAAYVAERPNTTPQIITVSEVDMGCTPDLREIVEKVKNAMFDPQNNAVSIHLEQTGATAWILKSGTVWCIGTNSEPRRVALDCISLMQGLGFPARLAQCETYFYGLCELNFPICFGKLDLKLNPYCSFVGSDGPGTSPWLVIKTTRPGVKLIIYASGTIAVVGTMSYRSVYEVLANIQPILQESRRDAFDLVNESYNNV